MIQLNKLRYNEQKSWYIGSVALLLTILCTFTLHLIGEPHPYKISIPRGLLTSLVLNAPLWFASIKFIRVKFKYPISFFIFISSLAVFFATPWGWGLAFVSLAFHWWLIFDLITSTEKLALAGEL